MEGVAAEGIRDGGSSNRGSSDGKQRRSQSRQQQGRQQMQKSGRQQMQMTNDKQQKSINHEVNESVCCGATANKASGKFNTWQRIQAWHSGHEESEQQKKDTE